MLGRIAPPDRPLLKIHGWLLLAWSVGISVLTSVFLLRVAHVHSMALRYACTSAVFYAGGFLFGGWCCVRWWISRESGPRQATAEDEIAYGEAQNESRKKIGWWDYGNWLPSPTGDDPISLFFLGVAILFMVAIALSMIWMLPGMASDALGSYVAELLIEFVVGAAVFRKLTRPRPIGQYWPYALRSTWIAGAFLVVLFTAAGFAIQQVNPEARTIVEFVRGH